MLPPVLTWLIIRWTSEAVEAFGWRALATVVWSFNKSLHHIGSIQDIFRSYFYSATISHSATLSGEIMCKPWSWSSGTGMAMMAGARTADNTMRAAKRMFEMIWKAVNRQLGDSGDVWDQLGDFDKSTSILIATHGVTSLSISQSLVNTSVYMPWLLTVGLILTVPYRYNTPLRDNGGWRCFRGYARDNKQGPDFAKITPIKFVARDELFPIRHVHGPVRYKLIIAFRIYLFG